MQALSRSWMAPLAAAPLVEASRPRSRRHLAPCLIAAAALSAVAGARRGPSAAAAAAMGAAAAALDGDGSGDDTHDDYAYSYLYECSDGDPQVDVAASYANGSWGSIAGEWYVVAGTQAASENLAGDCCRMKFALGDGGAAMSQWMWYEGDDGGGAAVGYEWNFTGSVEYDGEAGVWSATRGARARAREVGDEAEAPFSRRAPTGTSGPTGTRPTRSARSGRPCTSSARTAALGTSAGTCAGRRG